jgi:hypothetical protein
MKKIVSLFICLFTVCHLRSQDVQAEQLKRQVQDYQSTSLQEKLFVHTDKTFYLAGETIWFKIYSVDASFHKPMESSSIAYIEVISRELKPVLQTKIPMLHGSGNGSLTIPGFLSSGNYTLRAYTSWMKNFPPEFFFEQNIQIVNTLKLSAVSSIRKSSAAAQFFPEGGNEVATILQKIAFKVTGSDGYGEDCKGMIVNQQNDTIASIQTLHDGMGNFQLRPELNASYYAILKLKDTIIKQKLPEAFREGFVMQVSEEDSGKLMIHVKASGEFQNTPVYLLSQTRQQLKNIQTNMIRNSEADFLVDRKDLGEGVSVLTLFNNLRQPVCERLIFKRPAETDLLQVKPDQSAYNVRSPVTINLAGRGYANHSSAGNYSLAVFMIDSLQSFPQENIISYLYLSSDLKGRIESPEYYFSQTGKKEDEALDNLLLTQGWRRFKWDEVLENKKPYFEFLPEMEGAVVNGKIINKLTGAPVGATGAYLSIPGADYAFSSATSDANGNIHFGFRDAYKNNVVVVQPALLKDSNYRVDISGSYSDKYPAYSFRPFEIQKDQENTLVNRSISSQVENTFVMDRKRRFTTLHTDSTSFYGKPDREYLLDNYTRFQTLEEALREFVEDLRVRKEGEKFTFRVRNQLFNTYLEESPLILIDGIPVADANRAIALDPLKLYKIELVLHNYYLGSSQFAGIVNFKSYFGDLGSTQIDPGALVVEYEGLQNQREFYSPAYATKDQINSHIPDFRNVLFWAPQIRTGTDEKSGLSFYTSDVKGKYAVFMQGISADGVPAKAVSYFDVTDSR